MSTHADTGRDPSGVAPGAASHPSAGTGVLAPYVPRLQAEWLAERPGDTWRALDGSIVFVDVSGFTKLSERLAKQGKVGAEDLADAIGACFSSLLGVAYGNGGGLLKFGGDALLLWFSGPAHELRACRAAIGMRRTLRDVGRIEAGGGRVTLRMSVGVHSGTFHHFLVGGNHRELIVTGAAASTTVEMESTAEAGEILVSDAVAAALPGSAVGDVKGRGRLLRRAPPGLSVASAIDAAPLAVDLAVGVPEAVRSCLLAGLDEPEHKQVTVAFVHFDGTDELIATHGPAVTAGRLDELVRVTQDAAARHGVCFLSSDIDHDGGKLILAAGVPTSAGNDEERMLCALRDIVDAGTSIPVRIGVNRGHVFAGDIGPAYRRTYTVMGDAVNLAARLMSRAAPGEILATADVLDRSRAPFEATALEPFMVKGKARPVHAFAVGRARHDADAAPHDDDVRDLVPLVGRDAELEVLLRSLRSVHDGRGRLVEVVGEPGIGKSRLVDELVRRAEDTAVLRLACGLYEASTPYVPFRRLLRELLGLTPAADPTATGARLAAVVDERAPDLRPWLPLLAIVVDAVVAATPESDALDERFRRERLEETTTTFLGCLLDGPTLIVVEDGHWMDEPSAHLLGRIVSRLADGPWLVCVSRRDVDSGFAAPDGPLVTTLRLQPLDAFSATVLADAASEEAPLAPHEVAILTERAGGNPLFLRELVAAAAAAGGVDALPDSVEAVVSARIDRLAPPDRSLLRRLAVLGSTFERTLATATFADELGAGDTGAWRRLADFVTEDGPMVRFRHALVRDAAYEGLPFRVRQRIHAHVGETLLRDAPADDARVALLALHFFCAHRFDEAWRHARDAARHAVAAFANVEAAELYERAIESARRTADVPPDELAEVHEALGDVRNRLGEYRRASAAYRAARRLRAGDAIATARLLRKHARVSFVSDRTVDALRWLSRADQALEGLTGPEADRERAQVAVNMAGVRREQGRSTEAVLLCERAVAAAKAGGDLEALAHAYYLLDAAWVVLGRFDLAVHSADALALYEELGDHGGQGVVLNNMGTQAYWQGRWDDALALYDRGRRAREKVGDAVNAAYGTVNVAEILCDQGRLDEAQPLLHQVLRVWRAAGDRGGVAYALGHLARVAYRSGRFDDATAMLDDAIAEAVAIGNDLDVVELEGRRAESHLLRGDPVAALAVLDAAIAAARSTGGAAVHLPPLLRLRCAALAGTGARDEALAALDEALAAAGTVESDYEIALVLRLRAQLTGSAADAASSDHVLARLGVVRVFDPPWATPLETTAP